MSLLLDFIPYKNMKINIVLSILTLFFCANLFAYTDKPSKGDTVTAAQEVIVDDVMYRLEKKYITLEVAEFKTSNEVIRDLFKTYHGNIWGEETFTTGEKIQSTIQITLPSEDVEGLLSALDAASIDINQQKTAYQDINPKIQEILTRLDFKNKQLSEEKGKSKHSSHSSSGIVAELEEEIEVLNGSLAYWKRQMSKTEFQITFFQTNTPSTVQEAGFAVRMSDAFRNGLSNFSNVALALAAYWPLCLLALLILIWRMVASANRTKHLEKLVRQAIIEAQIRGGVKR